MLVLVMNAILVTVDFAEDGAFLSCSFPITSIDMEIAQ